MLLLKNSLGFVSLRALRLAFLSASSHPPREAVARRPLTTTIRSITADSEIHEAAIATTAWRIAQMLSWADL